MQQVYIIQLFHLVNVSCNFFRRVLYHQSFVRQRHPKPPGSTVDHLSLNVSHWVWKTLDPLIAHKQSQYHPIHFSSLVGPHPPHSRGGLIKPQLGGPIQVVNPKVKISAHALYSRLSITYFCTQISQNLIFLERQYITCNELSVADDSWIA